MHDPRRALADPKQTSLRLLDPNCAIARCWSSPLATTTRPPASNSVLMSGYKCRVDPRSSGITHICTK